MAARGIRPRVPPRPRFPHLSRSSRSPYHRPSFLRTHHTARRRRPPARTAPSARATHHPTEPTSFTCTNSRATPPLVCWPVRVQATNQIAQRRVWRAGRPAGLRAALGRRSDGRSGGGAQGGISAPRARARADLLTLARRHPAIR